MSQGQAELHGYTNEDWKLIGTPAQRLVWLRRGTTGNSLAEKDSMLNMQREQRLGKGQMTATEHRVIRCVRETRGSPVMATLNVFWRRDRVL
jgi:hypothetical protein